MAIRHLSTSMLIPAVGYLRRSTEKQEQSLTDQKQAIERYAAEHGYRIVRWFQDDGISGDATEKRLGFQAMHKAACNGRDFDCIIVWDMDRFGRFNSMEAGYWIHPLMKAGVKLVTVNEGPVNWDDFTGRMMFSMKQEGKHQFLRDLSRNTARGQVSNARKGYLCGQAAPYGYDRMLVDEAGNHKQRIHHGEQYAKSRAWHVTLVPSDDAERVATVRWLFDQYAYTDTGIRSLVDDLNRRGVPGPTGGKWYMGTVRMILRNENYTGTFTWAKRRLGKYNRVAGGEIKPRETGGPAVKMNPREEQIIVKDAHPALIDEELFQAVQAKLGERKERKTANRRKNSDCYILSGVVYCGHCGQKMYGTKTSRRKNGKLYEYPKYICSTYQMKGRSCGCGHHAIDQGPLLTFILEKVRALVFGGGHKAAFADAVREQLKAERTTDPAEVEGLRAKLTGLERDMDLGTKRLLRAPDDVADLLAGELSSMRKERDRVVAQLAALERTTDAGDVEADTERTVARLWELSDDLQTKIPPARLREVVHQLVDRIDLYFDRLPLGERERCPFSKGSLQLRPGLVMFRHDYRGDWI
jgi:DNA invertase Pin-like site-specific DNA recombinase